MKRIIIVFEFEFFVMKLKGYFQEKKLDLCKER